MLKQFIKLNPHAWQSGAKGIPHSADKITISLYVAARAQRGRKAPQTGQGVHVSCEIPQHLLDGLEQHFCTTIYVSQTWNPNDPFNFPPEQPWG